MKKREQIIEEKNNNQVQDIKNKPNKHKVTRIFYTFYKFFRKTLLDFIFNVITRVVNITVIIWLGIYYCWESLILTLTPASWRYLKSLRDKKVLVTGGAGGLGRELVARLARYKAKIVVWDVNEKAMKSLKEKMKESGTEIYTYPVDLSSKENIYKYAEIVKQEVGNIDIVINNAGVVCGQTILEIPDYMIEKTFKVNTLSCYWTTKAFLPEMIKRGRGHIVTVSSLTGLLGTYNCTDYSASKFATVGFHESLAIELKSQGYKKIHTTIVCPYFINTGMFEGCKPNQGAMLEPQDVAKRIVLAIRRNEVFVTMPAYSRFIMPLKNYFPAKFVWLLVYRVLRLPQSMMPMRHFTEVEAA